MADPGKLRNGILLFGLGVSSIGDLIYLVALNVFVLDQTHSPAAVAGLWVFGKVAALVVGPWAGSVTDRLSHRKQLIVVEVARAALVGVLPLLSQLSLVYATLFLLGVCSTFFGNAFLPYQTLLVPAQERQRVNAAASMLKSGSLLIGPAIAGALLQFGHTRLAIWLDAVSFLVSALSLFFLPHFPLQTPGGSATAQAASAAAGAPRANGALKWALILTVIARHVRPEWLIGAGSSLAAAGYLVYALSHSFWWAVIGLVGLGVFGSAGNVGLTTFTQQTVPVAQMGRINNVVGPPQQVMYIVFILVGGWFAEQFGVRNLMEALTVLMCVLAVIMATIAWLPRHRDRFVEPSAAHFSH